MDRNEVAQIVAEYLDNRDDFASATATESQIVVETQGGQYFNIEVGPIPEAQGSE